MDTGGCSPCTKVMKYKGLTLLDYDVLKTVGNLDLPVSRQTLTSVCSSPHLLIHCHSLIRQACLTQFTMKMHTTLISTRGNTSSTHDPTYKTLVNNSNGWSQTWGLNSLWCLLLGHYPHGHMSFTVISLTDNRCYSNDTWNPLFIMIVKYEMCR